MAEINAGDPIVELFNVIRRNNEFITDAQFQNFIRNRRIRPAAGYYHVNRAFNNNAWANRMAQLRTVFREINNNDANNPDRLNIEQFVEFFRKLDNGDFNNDAAPDAGVPVGQQWYQTDWGRNAVDSLKELRTYAYATWGNDAMDAADHAIRFPPPEDRNGPGALLARIQARMRMVAQNPVQPNVANRNALADRYGRDEERRRRHGQNRVQQGEVKEDMEQGEVKEDMEQGEVKLERDNDGKLKNRPKKGGRNKTKRKRKTRRKNFLRKSFQKKNKKRKTRRKNFLRKSSQKKNKKRKTRRKRRRVKKGGWSSCRTNFECKMLRREEGENSDLTGKCCLNENEYIDDDQWRCEREDTPCENDGLEDRVAARMQQLRTRTVGGYYKKKSRKSRRRKTFLRKRSQKKNK